MWLCGFWFWFSICFCFFFFVFLFLIIMVILNFVDTYVYVMLCLICLWLFFVISYLLSVLFWRRYLNSLLRFKFNVLSTVIAVAYLRNSSLKLNWNYFVCTQAWSKGKKNNFKIKINQFSVTIFVIVKSLQTLSYHKNSQLTMGTNIYYWILSINCLHLWLS